MSELYPLLLLPDFRERIWGSRDLSVLYPHKSARGVEAKSEEPIGEAWLTGDDCRVANGKLAGQTLRLPMSLASTPENCWATSTPNPAARIFRCC